MERQTSERLARMVLLVGDPEITKILAINLAHADFDVISAHSGAEALSKAAQERPKLIILDSSLPDSDGLEVCKQLNGSPLTNNIPVIIITAKAEGEDKIAGIAAGAEACISKPFVPGNVVSAAQACMERLEERRNSDPLTRLPNGIQVNNLIETLINQRKKFAAIYIDINHLGAFNHSYDFRQGDSAIQLLAKIVRESVWLLGNPDDFVGHLGNDDFIIITSPIKAQALCEKIIADFDSQVTVIYNQSDLNRGFIELDGRLGRKQYPIMSLSISAVTNEKRNFDNHFQVSEVAAELRNYLRRFPGSNYCFDRRENGERAPARPVHEEIYTGNRIELKAMYGMLAWTTFLIREVERPIKGIRDCIDSFSKNQPDDINPEQSRSLEAIKENTDHLLRIFTDLEHVQGVVPTSTTMSLDLIDLWKSLSWIMTHVQGLAEQRGVKICLSALKDISPLLINGPSLTQALLYILRNEIKASVPGDKIEMSVIEVNDTFVTMEIINRSRNISPAELTTLFRGDAESLGNQGRANDLHLAKILIDGLGGNLSVISQKGEGAVFTVNIPRRWQSSVEEVKRLQSEVEKNGQAVCDQIGHVRRSLKSSVERAPSEIEESLDSVILMVHKLEMLCNCSLFLTDDLSYELENQEGRILKQEVEMLTISETILAINSEIAQLAQARHFFDPEHTKRVARNALAIADDLMLTRNERQTLYCAALLKDLELMSLPVDMLEPGVAFSLKQVANLRGCFASIRKSLLQLDGLSQALAVARQRFGRCEICNDSFSPSPSRGTKFSVSAEILAIVDTFDAMILGLHTPTMEPEEAVRQISNGGRPRFTPEVVSSFLKLWRRGGLQVATIRPRLEVQPS